jgi:hypothetical protein
MDNDNNIPTSETEAVYIVECEPQEFMKPIIARAKTGPKAKQTVDAIYSGIQIGRDKIVVDPEEVFKLAQLGLKNTEIANYLGVTEESIRYNFNADLAKGREQLKITLRRAMLHNAIANNNAAVQIFLAKNMLGMSDTPINSEDNAPLPWVEQQDQNATE